VQIVAILAGSISDTIFRQANGRHTVRLRIVRVTSVINFDGGKNVSTRTQNVLKWVNQARWFMNLGPLKRLPKGKRNEPRSCPIGRALQGKVEIQAGLGKVKIPYHQIPFEEASVVLNAVVEWEKSPAVVEFIKKFDGGKYPRLIK